MTLKKKSKKESREHQVLMGLVELYVKTGKPIGSNTLRENGFESLSSATIRNYFSELENLGFLKQSHASGGRCPTEGAFRLYAEEVFDQADFHAEDEEHLSFLKENPTKNLTIYLQNAAEKLSSLTGYATFLSSVRFDHDLILDIKLVEIDAGRYLCILITDFGQVFTEILSCERKLSEEALKRMQAYFLWRLKGQKEDVKEKLFEEEEEIAQKFYNEIMIRYIVRYSNFSDEEVYRTGFSKLLGFPEFSDPIALTTGLSLFENTSHMRQLLNDCTHLGRMRFWIGKDLAPYSGATSCAVIAVPFKMNQMTVGALGLLGPCRMPYRSLFGILNFFSESISQALTKSFYKFKLSFRYPHSVDPYINKEERVIMDQTTYKLLEIKD